MGQSKPALLRHNLIADRLKGASYTALALQYGIGYNTVRTLCHRYQQEGDIGLIPRTFKCGRRVKPSSSFRLVRLLAHLHPSWGIAYIVAEIARCFPDLALQSVRHYQRCIRRSMSKLPATVLPKTEVDDRARQAHDVWQIDAKERLSFTQQAQQGGCFLNITDEKTSALLQATVFPPEPDLSSADGGDPPGFATGLSTMGATQSHQD